MQQYMQMSPERKKKDNKVNLDNDDNIHGDDADGRDDFDEDALEDDEDDPDVIWPLDNVTLLSVAPAVVSVQTVDTITLPHLVMYNAITDSDWKSLSLFFISFWVEKKWEWSYI